jgi:hypothetical protein
VEGLKTVMVREKTLLILVCGFLCMLRAATPEQQARFFAGVYILESRTELCDTLKAQRFRALEKTTGMKAAEARALLVSLRDRPADWKRLHDRMMQIIAEASEPEPKNIRKTNDTKSRPVTKRR